MHDPSAYVLHGETSVARWPSPPPAPAPSARQLFARLLTDAGLTLAAASTYARCGQDVMALERRDEAGKYLIVRSTCKSRWCERCAYRRALRIRRNMSLNLSSTVLRMITLTLPHSDAPLHQQLDHLYSSFRRLRSYRGWKSRVEGGAYFLELTLNPKTRQWHPHLHVLVQGSYYDHSILRLEWRKASGAEIVHITLCRTSQGVARYVTKYLVAPIDRSTYCSDQETTDAIHALRSRRTIGCLGTWTARGIFKSKDDSAWRFVGWLAELRVKAAEGDRVAAALVAVSADLPPDAGAVEVDLSLLAPPPLPSPSAYPASHGPPDG